MSLSHPHRPSQDSTGGAKDGGPHVWVTPEERTPNRPGPLPYPAVKELIQYTVSTILVVVIQFNAM